jgi:ATP-dependent Clp protease ATP-binding subunit ClpC
LSDAHGRQVDARHAVFIMTSNIATEEGGKAVGFVAGTIKLPDYTGHLHRTFRPEFLNRVDEVVIFRPLSPDTLSKILDTQLADLYKRLKEQGFTLELSDEARALILQRGYDPVNGARPLQRAVERLLTRPLSTRILEDAFQPGDTIVAHVSEGRLRFETHQSIS